MGALNAYHTLWFLNLASDLGLIGQTYADRAEATGEMLSSRASRFLEVTVCTETTLQNGSDLAVAGQLGEKIYHLCFIAWSFNFSVRYGAKYRFG